MIKVTADDITTISNKDTGRNSRISFVIIFLSDIICRSPSTSIDLENLSYSEEPFPPMAELGGATNNIAFKHPVALLFYVH
jgi:hypothetical protein